MMSENTRAWAETIDGPLRRAAERIRDLNSDANSMIPSFGFRKKCKALAIEKITKALKESPTGRDIPAAQLQKVVDDWLLGALSNIDSSREVGNIIKKRESYASNFTTFVVVLVVLAAVAVFMGTR